MKIKFERSSVYHLSETSFNLDETKVSGKGNSDTAIFLKSDEDSIGDKERQMLNNLIRAIKHDPNLLPVFVISRLQNLPFRQIVKEVEAYNYIFFGTDRDQLSLKLSVPNNLPVNFMGKKIIFTSGLDNLLKDPNAKASLWNGLQKMFELK